MGFTLADIGYRLSWLDIKALFHHRRHDSAVNREFAPQTWFREDPLNQLVAEMIWEGRVANWQRAGSPEESMPQPVFAAVEQEKAAPKPRKTARQVRDELAAAREKRRQAG